MERLVDYIHELLFQLVAPIQQKLFPNGTTTSLYITLKYVVRLVVYGFLACVIASLTGTKKYIDKKMRWAQR
jgi:hypothetical protein